MAKRFEIEILDEAFDFLKSLDSKHYKKILFNIRKAQTENDPKLFKKLDNDIWEFRTLYQGKQYRLLSFWDKTEKEKTLVVATHGFIKNGVMAPEKKYQKQSK